MVVRHCQCRETCLAFSARGALGGCDLHNHKSAAIRTQSQFITVVLLHDLSNPNDRNGSYFGFNKGTDRLRDVVVLRPVVDSNVSWMAKSMIAS
jgi:hypothetical protein